MSELREAGSPYLRQHASDPVAWRAWGAAPFADAERRDLPVLVSIGYAACHWCHVMQRESFRDPETAAWLNERFIAVKVDREEHPDVDAYYMTALQALRGQGGWPLTAVTDTQGRPFFAGTYLPPNDRPGMPSFRRVMDSVSDAWRERRALVLEDAERLHAHLEGGMAAPPGSRWDPPATPHAQTDAASEADADPALDAVATELRDAEREALQACQARIDETHGGMSGAPKFPPHGLLRWWSRLDDADARRWRDRALTSLAHGGIADPLAGGVARYAVDEAWRVPHFEKMLSDNVQLLPRWAEAWRDGNDPTHLAAVRSTFAWLEAEMRLPGGLYATALDADSPGADGRSEEGAFYAWTANAFDEAVRDAVGDDAVAFARDAYGVSDVGPFEGRNVLRRTASDAELAARHGRTPDGAAEARERIRTALAAVRAERTRPARDDKALCGLQGLAILGLARAGRLCGEDAMIQRARELARATLDRFLDADGRLWRRAFGDRVGIAARLEDHAALGTGLLELHRADGDPAWARAAERRADAVMRDFADPDQGGFLSAPADPDDPLPLRPRALLDGALPADTVTAAELVFAVARLTGRNDLRERATAAVRPLLSLARRHPVAAASALTVLRTMAAPPRELVVTGPDAAGGEALWRVAARRPLDHVAVLRVVDPDAPPLGRGPFAETVAAPVAGAVPGTAPGSDGTEGGRAAAWLCERYLCHRPIVDPSDLAAQLDAPPDGRDPNPRRSG